MFINVEQQTSTIVEIIGAYQPRIPHNLYFVYLQQQKLLELTSPKNIGATPEIYNSRNYWSLLAIAVESLKKSIYNSRNYWSLLAWSMVVKRRWRSTIVEIIGAYQPQQFAMVVYEIYNSRNYWSLLATPKWART